MRRDKLALNKCYNCGLHFVFENFKYFMGYIFLMDKCVLCGHTNIVWCYKDELDLKWEDEDND